MKISPQEYREMERRAEPRSPKVKNLLWAFFTGGCICAAGQLIRSFFEHQGFPQDISGIWTSVVLVALSALLTGLGWYERLAKHAGAGTLVPVTGFSNAVSSAAIEAQSEGLVTGVGTKIFAIAGPVILYGCSAAFVYGVIYYILKG